MALGKLSKAVATKEPQKLLTTIMALKKALKAADVEVPYKAVRKEKANKVIAKQRKHKLLTPAMALKTAMKAVSTEKPLKAAKHYILMTAKPFKKSDESGHYGEPPKRFRLKQPQ